MGGGVRIVRGKESRRLGGWGVVLGGVRGYQVGRGGRSGREG